MKVIRPIDIGETQLLASNVVEADYPQWSAGTTYGADTRVISLATHRIYESNKVLSSVAVSISVGAPAAVTWLAHGLANGTKLTLVTTGMLPSGLAAGAQYYVVNATLDMFSLAAAPGGAAISTTAAGTGVHTASAQCNLNRNPALAASLAGNTPFWIEIGATNKWAMFDSSSTTQTSQAEQIVVTLRPGRASALALINLNASTARVVVASGGQVRYDKAVDLTIKNVGSLWQYFFEPIIRKTDVVLLDLPPYSDAEITVTINQPGSAAAIGALIPGMPREIGELQWAPEVRTKDYSRKTTDEFGNTVLKPGRTAKLLSCELQLDNDLVDETCRLLGTYNGLALVWVGTEQFTSTIVYGFFSDFKAVIQDPAGSRCNLEIEGLT